MPQVDGDIKLAVEISVRDAQKTISNLRKSLSDVFGGRFAKNTAGASESVATLERSLDKAQQRVIDLSTRMDEMRKSGVVSTEYQKLQQELEKANAQFDKLLMKQEEMIDTGRNSGKAWDNLDYQMESLGSIIHSIEDDMRELEESGKHIIPAENTDAYKQLSKELYDATLQMDKLKEAEKKAGQHSELVAKYKEELPESTSKVRDLINELNNLREQQSAMKEAGFDIGDAKFDAVTRKIASLNKQIQKYNSTLSMSRGDAWKSLGSTALSALSSIDRALTSLAMKAFNVYKRLASSMFGVIKNLITMRKQANQTSNAFNFKHAIKYLLQMSIGIGSITMLINKIRSAAQVGFQNLAQYSENVNRPLSEMKGLFLTLKNSVAAAFEPLLQIVLPILNQIVTACYQAFNALARFFGAFTGQAKVFQAKKVVDDFAKSAGGSAKEVKKALASYDELNVIQDNSGGGGAGGLKASDMFEEVEVDDAMKNLADTIKSWAKRIIAPFVKAWDSVGPDIIKSFKNTVGKLKNLFKSIAKDFLTVWEQDATEKIIESFLRGFNNIIKIVGVLADKIREAWEADDTGLHILENIRDLIGIVVNGFEKLTEITLDWVNSLNFEPLFKSFEGWTKSLAKPVQFIVDTFTSFYEKVILKFASFMIEDGLPKLFDVFTEFNNKMDWDKLKKGFDKLWESLEPFLEKSWNAVVTTVEKLLNAFSQWVDDGGFDAFVEDITKWLDSISQEDIEAFIQTLLDIAGAVIKITEALGKIVIDIATSDTVKNILNGFLTWVKDSDTNKIASTIKKIGIALLTLKAGLAAIKTVGAVAGTITNISNALKVLGGGGVSAGGIATAGGGMLSTLGTTMTMNMGELFSAAGLGGEGIALSFAEIGATAGASLIGAIVAAIAGFSFGKNVLGPALFPDDTSWYEEFSWFGEGGFFQTVLTSDITTVLWAVGQTVLDLLKKMFGWEHMKEGLGNITEGFTKIVDSIKDIFDPDKDTSIGEIGRNLISGIVEGFVGGFEIIFAPIAELFDTIVNGIKDIFGIHSPAEEMKPLGENILLGVIEGFTAKFEEFKTKIQTFFDEHIKPWFTKEKWEEIFAGMHEAMENMKQKVVDIFDSIKDALKEPINNVIGMIEGFANLVIAGINAVVTCLNNFKVDLPEIEVLGKTVYEGGSLGFNIPQLPDVSIPRLAKGGVIPANNEFLAILGDQKHGTNVEAPLETIKQAVAEVIAQMGGVGGNMPPVVLQLSGRTVAEVVWDEENKRYKQTGGR